MRYQAERSFRTLERRNPCGSDSPSGAVRPGVRPWVLVPLRFMAAMLRDLPGGVMRTPASGVVAPSEVLTALR